MKNKKTNKILLLSIIVLGLSIGFATLATTLKINGTTGIGKNTWNIYLDNIANQQGITPETAPALSTEGNNNHTTVVTWNAVLNAPGDYFEFTVDAVNAGTLDAMITGIESKINDDPIISTENGRLVVADPSPVPDIIKYSVTYADGKDIKLKQILPKANGNTETRRTYKIRVEYNENAITNESINNQSQALEYDFSFAITYGQADDTAIVPTTFQNGDYITLVPDASTYTVLASDSGYDTDQTITPNELTLWRVINTNQDGSVDAVSEYVSSENIYFKGATGYAKYVGTLQKIAASYAKAGYTKSTRMMGYDGQTLEIADTHAFDGSTSSAEITTTTPDPTTGTGEEYNGGVGGDTLYLKDYNLVGDVYKTEPDTYGTNGLLAYKKGATESSYYWIASRKYEYRSYYYFSFEGRVLDGRLLEYNIYNYFRNWPSDPYSYNWAVRPIITLNSANVEATGHGTKNDPYIFE